MLLSASEARANHRPWHSAGFLCSFFPFLPICQGANAGQAIDESQEEMLRKDIELYYRDHGYNKD